MRAQMQWGEVMQNLDAAANANGGGFGRAEANSNLYIPNIPTGGAHKSVIRFLPAFDSKLPWAEVIVHYIVDDLGVKKKVNCPKTIGNKCPICDSLKKIWADGDADKYRARKKRTTYYSNILVLEDEQNADNVGKVFLLRYGVQLHGLIKKLIEEEGNAAAVFGYDEGTDFKLIATKKGEFNNYDDSTFKRKSSPLSKEMQEYADANLLPLADFTDEKKFKSYDELAQEYQDSTGDAPQTWVKSHLSAPSSRQPEPQSAEKEDAPMNPTPSASKPRAESAPEKVTPPVAGRLGSDFFDDLDDEDK